MLVLARKPGEKIVLHIGGERVTMTVILIDGQKVRLAFEAPDRVKINRGEVQDEIDAGREQRRFDG